MPLWVAGNAFQARITDEGVTEWTQTIATSVVSYAVVALPSEKALFGHNVNSSITHRLRDAAGASLWTGNHGASIRAVAIDPDGNSYVVGDQEVGGVHYRKLDPSGAVIYSISSGGSCYAVSARGTAVMYVGNASALYARDPLSTSWVPTWSYGHGANIYAIVEDASGNIYIGGVRSSSVSVRKINAAGALQWSFDTGGDIYGLAIDDASGHLYAVGVRVGSTKTAWKLELDGTEVTTGWPTDHGATLRAVAVAPDGTVYVGGAQSGGTWITTRKYQPDGTEITAGDWPLSQATSIVYGLSYQPILQTLPAGLALPFGLALPLWTYSHRAATGLALSIGIAVPATSAPPIPPAPDLSLRAVYRVYLSTEGGDDLLEVPLAGLECTRRVGASTWIAVTVPSAESSLVSAVEARIGGELVIYAGVATASQETLGAFLRATLTEITVDRGPRSGVVNLTARVIPSPFIAGSYTLTGVVERGSSEGRRTVSCTVDPRIRPNDTVDDGVASWIAGTITYRIDPAAAAMRITEAL